MNATTGGAARECATAGAGELRRSMPTHMFRRRPRVRSAGEGCDAPRLCFAKQL